MSCSWTPVTVQRPAVFEERVDHLAGARAVLAEDDELPSQLRLRHHVARVEIERALGDRQRRIVEITKRVLMRA